MLKDYCVGQPVAYNIIKNAIINRATSHAYLLVSDNKYDAFSFAFSFAKTLLCPQNKMDNVDCADCPICKRIDSNNFPELTIVEPDGLWIKKNQLLELQERFRTKSLEGEKRVYIINQVDKLNVQAANSMLKFLEEPEDNIVAILTTDDIHGVIETIVSRCQTITLKKDKHNIEYQEFYNTTLAKIASLSFRNKDEVEKFINDEKNVENLESVVKFIKKYEVLKMDVLLDINRLWHTRFKEKKDFIWAFEVMTLFYRDVLNFLYNRDLDFFDYYKDVIEFVSSRNTKTDITLKMQKIIIIKEKIRYNINLNLLMDKLVFELESGGQL